MRESTSPSNAETFLRSNASVLAERRSKRLEPEILRRWTTTESNETITEPMWLARLGRLVDLNCSLETEVPRLSKPSGGHPWERVVMRRLTTLGMTLGQLAEMIDETPARIRLLFHYAPLWQSLEPRLSKALSTTSYGLAAAIERETVRIAEHRELQKAAEAQRLELVRFRRERAARRREQREARRESRLRRKDF